MFHHLDLASRRAEPDIVRLTQELIRIPEYSFEEKRIAIRLQDAFEQLSYDLVFQDDAGNLAGVLTGSSDGPTLLFLSHIDTVRPPAAELPDQALFSGRVLRGRVHGLEVAACKSALAAQVFGGHLFDTNVPSYRGNLVVAATVGDNDGNAVGTAHLLSETLPQLDLMPVLAVVGGPTGLALCNGADGRAESVASTEHASKTAVLLAHEGLVAAGWRDVGVRTWNPSCLKLGAAGSLLVGRHQIPTIGFGPGDGRNPCGRHEFVAVDALRRAALGNASIARAILE